MPVSSSGDSIRLLALDSANGRRTTLPDPRRERSRPGVAELGVHAGGGGAAEAGGRGELALARQAGTGGDASVDDQQPDLVGQVAVGHPLTGG